MKIFTQKNVKITKQAQVSKGFGSSYNVETLNSFKPELQLKDTKSETKNKLKNYWNFL